MFPPSSVSWIAGAIRDPAIHLRLVGFRPLGVPATGLFWAVEATNILKRHATLAGTRSCRHEHGSAPPILTTVDRSALDTVFDERARSRRPKREPRMLREWTVPRTEWPLGVPIRRFEARLGHAQRRKGMRPTVAA
jgi:hypothetical protein